MLSLWPLVVVLAAGAVILAALAAGRRLFRGTVTCRQSFWCREKGAHVDVEFQESAWDRRGLDVSECSAFDPPTAVTCAKACLHPTANGGTATARKVGAGARV
jgi:hypothetical protein